MQRLLRRSSRQMAHLSVIVDLCSHWNVKHRFKTPFFSFSFSFCPIQNPNVSGTHLIRRILGVCIRFWRAIHPECPNLGGILTSSQWKSAAPNQSQKRLFLPILDVTTTTSQGDTSSTSSIQSSASWSLPFVIPNDS